MQSDGAAQRDWTTTLIAVYGAVLATVVFLWDLYKRWADKGNLEVRSFIGVPLKTDDGKIAYVRIDATAIPDQARPFLVYKITNTGGAPVTVSHVGGRQREWKYFVPRSREFLASGFQEAETLEPTKYFLTTDDNFLQLGKLTELFAIDTRGNHYKAPSKDLRRVRIAISRIRANMAGSP